MNDSDKRTSDGNGANFVDGALWNENEDEMWTAVESSPCAGSESASACGGGARGGGGAPCARGKHSATLLGAHIYVLGGRGAGGAVPLRDFWRYSLVSGRWERLEARGEAPPALQEHSATAHGARLYVFGGEPGTVSTETPLWIYDTQTQVWRKLAGASLGARRRGARAGVSAAAGGPRGRRGHSAHALQDCLLVYGGYKDLRGSTNELWAFHYESESWQQVRTAGAGPARHRHAAALHAGRLYVHGGQCDLRDCADLSYYDTVSRTWTRVRAAGAGGGGGAPGARAGHTGLRAGGHFYIFGGEAGGQPTNELWRFHFATETWERIAHALQWPSARVDACALLVPGGLRGRCAALPAAPRAAAPVAPRPDPPASLLREISKLSSFHIRRGARCSYSVLAGERDSTESLVRHDAALSKSLSAYAIEPRLPADGGESPREGDLPDLAREPLSVPDFADMALPTPALSPVQAAKLVYLDSEEEEEAPARRRRAGGALPKSASVRFSAEAVTVSTDDSASTSDYASAERVNRLAGALGFSNPHYLGPDVRALSARAAARHALTPDSGVGAGDIELQDLGARRARSAPSPPAPLAPHAPLAPGDTRLHLLLVGGREPPHLARLQCPLSMWTYRLL